MRLLFLGDIAISDEWQRAPKIDRVFHDADVVLANLEGPVISQTRTQAREEPKDIAVYSTESVSALLNAFRIQAVYLANNHIFDLPQSLSHAESFLKEKEISHFGVGANIVEASVPFTYSDSDTAAKIFAFGWDVIGCRVASASEPGVNPLSPEWMFQTIRQVRRKDKNSFVVFVLHWNYELEQYPQPAHRQLAHALIKEGVDAIIGLHPHVVQGAEIVDGKPIIYSLGNWFFPPRRYGQFHLSFPPIANRELALELVVSGRSVKNTCFHWYQFEPQDSSLQRKKSEGWNGEILKQLTPYAGMSHQEYCQWFQANRTRRRGLPIYFDYRHKLRNRVKDAYVRLRQQFIEGLVRLQLKQHLSGK